MEPAVIRAQVETALASKFPSPFTFREYEPETVSTGIAAIDSITGGLPRGGLTEVVGAESSGRTSLLLSVLAQMTGRDEVCALIDGCNSFNVESASAAAIDLERLLWVRCHNLEQAYKATDLVIQSGGFGLVAVDLANISPALLRRIPLNSWFRFRRAVEDTPTVLLIIEQEAHAKTCASLVLRLEADSCTWSGAESIWQLDCGQNESTVESRKSNFQLSTFDR